MIERKNVSMEIYDFVHRQSIKIPSFDYQSRVRYLTRSHLNALKIFPSFPQNPQTFIKKRKTNETLKYY